MGWKPLHFGLAIMMVVFGKLFIFDVSYGTITHNRQLSIN
jgi:hypothetical protein